MQWLGKTIRNDTRECEKEIPCQKREHEQRCGTRERERERYHTEERQRDTTPDKEKKIDTTLERRKNLERPHQRKPELPHQRVSHRNTIPERARDTTL